MNQGNTIHRTKKLSLDRQIVRNLTPEKLNIDWEFDFPCPSVTKLASGCSSAVHADALGQAE